MTTAELDQATERILMLHFHEDEPSPLLEPEENDAIRDDCIAVAEAWRDEHRPRPLDEWDQDRDHSALWWKYPINEPPYCGSPLCDDWPGYHTHWTPIPLPFRPRNPAQ